MDVGPVMVAVGCPELAVTPVSGDDLWSVAEVDLSGDSRCCGIEPAAVALAELREQQPVDPDRGFAGDPGNAVIAVVEQVMPLVKPDRGVVLWRSGDAVQVRQRGAELFAGPPGDGLQPAQCEFVEADFVVSVQRRTG